MDREFVFDIHEHPLMNPANYLFILSISVLPHQQGIHHEYGFVFTSLSNCKRKKAYNVMFHSVRIRLNSSANIPGFYMSIPHIRGSQGAGSQLGSMF